VVFRVILEPCEEDGGYTACVPSLPGCISEGDTIDEAMANIKEAIDLYLEPVDDDFTPGEGTLVKELVL
jgi:predicted RNase H-like HicB family nuclease